MKEVNQQISLKEEFRNIKDLKRRLYTYEVLGKKRLFNFSEMMDEYEKLEVNNLKLYKSIYLRISSIQSTKKKPINFSLEILQIQLKYVQNWKWILNQLCPHTHLK